MKKKLILFLLTAMCAFAAAGSPAASVSSLAAQTPAAAQPGNTELYASELTGLPVSSALAAQRPVAVMIDNDLRALPHAGLAEADLVYEMMNSTANNRVTRLMAVYKDWQSVRQIGNIRSTRPTNILLASEWDAILIHDGGPFYNDPYFAVTGIQHLSGGFSRIRNGKASEFTEYAKSGEISNPDACADAFFLCADGSFAARRRQRNPLPAFLLPAHKAVSCLQHGNRPVRLLRREQACCGF